MTAMIQAQNQKPNVTFGQFLRDIGYTFAIALATGAAVGGLSFVVVGFLGRAS